MTLKLLLIPIVIVVALVIWLLLRRSSTPEESPRRRATEPGPDPGGRASIPAGLSAQRNWLVGTGGDVQGKTFHIGERTATIGRGLGNFVQTTDDDASRVHCQFMPVPGGLQVKDMGSSNGTFVNGAKVAVALLKDGDVVQVGRAQFVYRATGQFHVDHGLERKTAGKKAAKQTHMGELRDLGGIIRQTLVDAGGDVERAAGMMGVKPDQFRALMQQYGIDPTSLT